MPRPKLPKTYKLVTPLNDGEKEIKELVLKVPPNSGDFWKFNAANPTFGSYLEVMASIFRIPEPVIKKLDMADTAEIIGDLSNFLER